MASGRWLAADLQGGAQEVLIFANLLLRLRVAESAFRVIHRGIVLLVLLKLAIELSQIEATSLFVAAHRKYNIKQTFLNQYQE